MAAKDAEDFTVIEAATVTPGRNSKTVLKYST
jgi:hypothetical protein